MHQAYFVYKITSTATPKIYIGATKEPKNRWRKHVHDARKGRNTLLYNAMRKYGTNTFVMEILYETDSEASMFAEEIRLIAEYRSNTRDIGYNICAGGEGASHPTAETTKQTLSEIAKQTWASKSSEEMKAFKAKMKSVGADISEETRKLRSESAKAQHSDPEMTAKHQAAVSKANQDPEKRRKIAEAAKARWADPEFKARMSICFKNRNRDISVD